MAIYDHVNQFAGKQVIVFEENVERINPEFALKLTLDWEQVDNGKTLMSMFESLVVKPYVGKLEALIIGVWEEAFDQSPDEYIQFLVNHKNSFSNLKALFFAEQTGEENEISWIQQGRYWDFWAAFPNLQLLRIRGAESLDLGIIRHSNLHTLIIESGGLPSSVVNQVVDARLPALKHLSLWLGTDEYGGDADKADIENLVRAYEKQGLTHLGLCNSQIQGEVIEAVLNSNICQGLEHLDFSKGVLKDSETEILFLQKEKLQGVFVDLSENYLSDEICDKLASVLEVCVDRQEQAQEYDDETHYYVSVGE